MKKQTKILIMKHFILSILFSLTLLISCEKHRDKIKVYETTNQKGYCYNDGLLWYIFYYDVLTDSYRYQGSYSSFNYYDSSSSVVWTPSSETVSNFQENQSTLEQSISEIQESSGESVGGSDNSSDTSSNDNGISESSGESSGGSDGGDSGGGDGGGGE